MAKVIFTAFLYVSPVQMIPSCDQTGVPGFVGFTHFHSSTTSGSASLMIPRTLLSVSPRQSPSSSIRASISWEGESSPFVLLMSSSLSVEPAGFEPATSSVQGKRSPN